MNFKCWKLRCNLGFAKKILLLWQLFRSRTKNKNIIKCIKGTGEMAMILQLLLGVIIVFLAKMRRD